MSKEVRKIPGTPYDLHLGLLNNKWACRILLGKEVLDIYVFKNSEVGSGF